MIDLTGKRIYKLTVLGRNADESRRTRWVCECDCGNAVSVFQSHLTGRKKTQSCGCRRAENRRESAIHGMSNTRLHRLWSGIISRCDHTYHVGYCDYGGRGITVCDRWRDFRNFYADMSDSYAPGLQIERIDNSGNYEPSNCRWATRIEQANNKRNNVSITVDGVTKTVANWAREIGITPQAIHQRIKLFKWTPEKAVTTTNLRPTAKQPRSLSAA